MVDDTTAGVPPIEPKPAAAKPKAAAPKPKAAAASSKPAAAKAPASKTTASKTTASKAPASKSAPPPPVPPADRPNPYLQSSPPPAPAAPQPYMNGPYVAPPAQGLSITSMVLGIAGVLFSFCYGGGFLPSLAAVITGHLAVKRQPYAKGFWLTGIITGYVGLGISVLWVIGVVMAFLFTFALSAPYSGYLGY